MVLKRRMTLGRTLGPNWGAHGSLYKGLVGSCKMKVGL